MNFKKVLAFMSFILLVACHNETGPNLDSDVTTLTMWHYYTAAADELSYMVDRYNDENEHIKVELEFVPFDEIAKQLSIGLAGDVLPDIVMIDSVETAAFASIGVLKDITDSVIASGEIDYFLPGPVESTQVDGRYYGIPFEGNALALFYNEDIFAAAGISSIPETWDEVLEVSQKILDYDPSLTPFGMTAVRNEQSTFQFIPFLYSAGGTYDNLASEGGIKALSFVTELMNKGYMRQDFLNQDQDDMIQLFAAGNVAMMVNGPWAIPSLEEIIFSIGNLPKDQEFTSVLGGANLAVIEGQHALQAVSFLEFFLEEENVREFARRANLLPVRADVLKSDDWSNDPMFSRFIEPMQVAVPRGPSANWPAISENIQLAVLNGD